MQLCKKSLVLTGAIWPETITPTLLQRLPAHSDAAPPCFTILGVLLTFCSQISQAARKVHYSWSGEDSWLQTHHPSPSRAPGSPRKGCFGRGGGRDDTPRAPQETLPEGTAPRPWGTDCFYPFLAFSPHPAAVGTAWPPREGQPPPCPGSPGRRRG